MPLRLYFAVGCAFLGGLACDAAALITVFGKLDLSLDF